MPITVAAQKRRLPPTRMLNPWVASHSCWRAAMR